MSKLYDKLKGKAKEAFDQWYVQKRKYENDEAGEDVLPVDFRDIKLKLTEREIILDWLGSAGFHYSFQHEGGVGYSINLSDHNYRTGVGALPYVYGALVSKCVQLYNEGKDVSQRHCIVCEKPLHRLDDYISEFLDGGATDKFSMGFGSMHDLDVYRFAICDGCVQEKKNKKIIKKIR